MSVNSHFIPQLLLKGFAFRREGNEYYVYVFREGSDSFPTNTKNVASQRNFYGDVQIEGILSAREDQFATLVRDLRQERCNPSDKPIIDRFVAHSLIRTRRFRKSVHAIGATVMDEVFREYLNPEHAPDLLRKLASDVMTQPDVRKLLDSASPEQQPYLDSAIRQSLTHPDMLDRLREMILQTLPTIDTASSVQSAQRQVLEDESNLDERTSQLKPISWSVQTYSPNSLVLGDIGPLVRGDESPEWGRVFCGAPQLIWFPLSDTCLLRGQLETTPQSVDSEAVNLASAENSEEFFVATQCTKREEEYHKRLGLRARQFTDENLAELKQDVRKHLKSS